MEKDFSELSIKFLFVYENPLELNALLNDLNSLDYKYHQISNGNKIVQFIDSLEKIDVQSETSIKIKTFFLIKQLISKQKINLPEVTSNKIIKWIIQSNKNNLRDIFACEGLDVLALLFKKNSKAVLSVSLKLCLHIYLITSIYSIWIY